MITEREKNAKKDLWTCPTCGRKFQRRGQSHSCRLFQLQHHFDNKPDGKALYQKLRHTLKNTLGTYKVESLACCIHFVNTFAFAAVKVFKDKIRVEFTLNRKIRHNRITQIVSLSAHRYLYSVDVVTAADIDAELIAWIKEAWQERLDI
nr:DUF5655 domain-containing protein [Chryseolinea lacunae]